ncbi:MAG: hypothetical protein ACFFG0_06370 [Candidatus Thorarchaeota archaeon]
MKKIILMLSILFLPLLSFAREPKKLHEMDKAELQEWFEQNKQFPYCCFGCRDVKACIDYIIFGIDNRCYIINSKEKMLCDCEELDSFITNH